MLVSLQIPFKLVVCYVKFGVITMVSVVTLVMYRFMKMFV